MRVRYEYGLSDKDRILHFILQVVGSDCGNFRTSTLVTCAGFIS